MITSQIADSGMPPKQLSADLWVFPPNKHTNGGTAWWLGCDPEPILIDCPPLTSSTIEALQKLSSGRAPRIILTNRDAHGRISELQELLGWPVLVQEQEAYLLPGLSLLESFVDEHKTASEIRLLWTPGPTPGSCVVYASAPWNVLFCGRLLIPVATDQLAALPNRRTFHWPRQQRSLAKLRKWLPRDARPLLASGAGLGMLSGKELVAWQGWKC